MWNLLAVAEWKLFHCFNVSKLFCFKSLVKGIIAGGQCFLHWKSVSNAFDCRYDAKSQFLRLKIDSALYVRARCSCVCVYVTECKYWCEVELLSSTFLRSSVPSVWSRRSRVGGLSRGQTARFAQTTQQEHNRCREYERKSDQQITCNWRIETITLCDITLQCETKEERRRFLSRLNLLTDLPAVSQSPRAVESRGLRCFWTLFFVSEQKREVLCSQLYLSHPDLWDLQGRVRTRHTHEPSAGVFVCSGVVRILGD